jgi:hypothetical protein
MVCHCRYLEYYRVYCGMSDRVPGTLLGVPWYAARYLGYYQVYLGMLYYCMYLEFYQVYNMTGKIVCVHTHPVVTDGDQCITVLTQAMCDIQF